MTYYENMVDSTPGIWEATDAWASEKECGEFFYGLVRLLKPSIVIETGTYHGDTARQIGKALRENQHGVLFTCDIKKFPEARFDGLPVTFFQREGIALLHETDHVDLAFLDSSADRVAEAQALRLSRRGIVVLHDARRDTLKDIVEKTGWQTIFIDTPRGCAILQPKRSL